MDRKKTDIQEGTLRDGDRLSFVRQTHGPTDKVQYLQSDRQKVSHPQKRDVCSNVRQSD